MCVCVFTFAAACARTYFMPTKFTCAALSFPPLVIITFIYYYYLCSLSRIHSRRGSSSSICAVVARPVSLSYILHAFFLSLRFVAPSCLLARSPSSAALRNYERGHRMATVAVVGVGVGADCDWDWARGAEEHASASATSLRFALTLKLFGFSLLFLLVFFFIFCCRFLRSDKA